MWHCFVSQGERTCFCSYLLKAVAAPNVQASVLSEDILLSFSASSFHRTVLLLAVGDGSSASDFYSLYYLLGNKKKVNVGTTICNLQTSSIDLFFITRTNNSLSSLLFVEVL